MTFVHEISEFADVFGNERGTRKITSDSELFDRIAHDVEVEGLQATITSLRAHDRELLTSARMSDFLFDEIYQASLTASTQSLRDWLGNVRARPGWTLHFFFISPQGEQNSIMHFAEKGHLVGAPFDFANLYRDETVTLSCGTRDMGGYSFPGRGSVSGKGRNLCPQCAENSKDHYERKARDATNMLPEFDLVDMKQAIVERNKAQVCKDLLGESSLEQMLALVDKQIEEHVIDWAANKYTKFARAHGIRTFYNWGEKATDMIAPVLRANLQKSDWLTFLQTYREKTLVIEKGNLPASHVWEEDYKALIASC